MIPTEGGQKYKSIGHFSKLHRLQCIFTFTRKIILFHLMYLVSFGSEMNKAINKGYFDEESTLGFSYVTV